MTATPQELVERGLEASTSDGCVVVLRHGTSANLRWANNTLTTNGVMRSVTATVVSFVRTGDGVAAGSVTGSAASREQVEALVEAADAAARGAEAAEDAADLVAPRDADAGPSDDWWDEPAETSIEVYGDVAPALGEAFRRSDAEGRVLYGFVDHDVTTTYLGSSTGLRLRHVQPSGHYGVTGKPRDLSSSAWVGGATHDFRDVDPTALEAELARRLRWAERRVDLPAGRYDTVLPPTAVADLMIYAYWRSPARDAADGQTVFSRPGGGTRIGERLSPHPLRMWSDPAEPGLACLPFVVASASTSGQSVFDNGLPLARTDWIADGTLSALVQTRLSARLTDQPVTPEIDNLAVSVDGGSGSAEDLAAGMERGLLLTCLWYIREVDPQTLLLTGLTRDGVYLVEGGEVVGEVNNYRFNESPVDLLRRFSHAGTTVPAFSREWGDEFTRTAMPALRVPDFNMSTVSAAR